MTQFCCYRVWDGSLEKFRKTVLVLSTVELLVTSSVIAFVGISLYNVSFEDPPEDSDASNSTRVYSPEFNETICESGEVVTAEGYDCMELSEMGKNLNQTQNARFFPVTPYFQVVGHQIVKSIQLVIFTVQLFVTTLYLIRGLTRVDTQSMRTWLIVTEIISTALLLILILYLFGDFRADTVLILGAYLIYQFMLIRTVSRLIRRTEIELTQFGSVVEF